LCPKCIAKDKEINQKLGDKIIYFATPLSGLPPLPPSATATPLYAQIDRSKKSGNQPTSQQQQQNYTNLGESAALKAAFFILLVYF
jgi:hypothetical protein